MTQLEKSVSADDKIDKPVRELLWWAAQCEKRVRDWPRILKERPLPLLAKYAAKEDEFVTAYRTAICARAFEIVRYCDEIGILGVTEEYVRGHPFEIALAVDAHAQEEAPDDAYMEMEIAIDILHAGPWRLFKDWFGFQWFRLWRRLKGKA